MYEPIKYYSGKYIKCPCGRTILKERYTNHTFSMLHTDYLFINHISDKLDLREIDLKK